MKTLAEFTQALLAMFTPEQPLTNVVIIEFERSDFGGKSGPIVRRSRLKTIDEYRPRFEQLMSKGYGWINLSYYGLLSGRALIGIELPAEPVGANRTSVNISGPREDVQKAGGDATVAIQLVD